jgi:hypothetical protein
MALSHAGLFAIMICDPMNALWLNTLYTEFAALFFVLVGRADGTDLRASFPTSARALAGHGIALSLVGSTRVQHLLYRCCWRCRYWFRPQGFRRLMPPCCWRWWRCAWHRAWSSAPRSPRRTAPTSCSVRSCRLRWSPAYAQRLFARALPSHGCDLVWAMGESLQKTCPEARGSRVHDKRDCCSPSR